MPSLQDSVSPPTALTVHRLSRQLSISFEEETFILPIEYLRVYSPSAEVKGHGPGQEVLQTGKRLINIEAINPVGLYAIQIVFSDGHDTGLFSWEYLYDLASHHEVYWNRYLTRIKEAGVSRDTH